MTPSFVRFLNSARIDYVKKFLIKKEKNRCCGGIIRLLHEKNLGSFLEQGLKAVAAVKQPGKKM